MTGHDGSRQGFLRMNAAARWFGETLFSRWGVEAPRSLPVYREEIWHAVREENRAAADAPADLPSPAAAKR